MPRKYHAHGNWKEAVLVLSDVLVPPNARPPSRLEAVRAVTTAMARETDPKKRIVITGMGLVSVFGNDYEKFYDKLLEGTSGVAPIDRFDTTEFPTKFAAQIREFDNEGIVDKKNARRMDPCLLYALVSGNKAMVDAGLGGDRGSHSYIVRAGPRNGTGNSNSVC